METLKQIFLNESRTVCKVADKIYLRVQLNPNDYFSKCINCGLANLNEKDGNGCKFQHCGCGFWSELDEEDIQTIKKLKNDDNKENDNSRRKGAERSL